MGGYGGSGVPGEKFALCSSGSGEPLQTFSVTLMCQSYSQSQVS